MFFIICSTKTSLRFMIESFLYFKLLQTSLGITKWIVFSSAIISLLSLRCTPIFSYDLIRLMWSFLVFYYGDKVDTLFVWFHFLVCMNYLQVLFSLVILKVWLTVCLELKFLILFRFLLFHHFLVVVDHQVLTFFTFSDKHDWFLFCKPSMIIITFTFYVCLLEFVIEHILFSTQ